MEVGGEAINASVANVGSVDEGQEPQAEEPWDNVTVEFAGDTLVELGIAGDVDLRSKSQDMRKWDGRRGKASIPMWS